MCWTQHIYYKPLKLYKVTRFFKPQKMIAFWSNKRFPVTFLGIFFYYPCYVMSIQHWLQLFCNMHQGNEIYLRQL